MQSYERMLQIWVVWHCLPKLWFNFFLDLPKKSLVPLFPSKSDLKTHVIDSTVTELPIVCKNGVTVPLAINSYFWPGHGLIVHQVVQQKIF